MSEGELVERVDQIICQGIHDLQLGRSGTHDIARGAIAEVQRWRPIETAPRDGTWFIAYRPLAMATGDKTVDIVQGVDHPTTSPQGIVHWTSRWCHPTHWIPLPVPPKQVDYDDGDHGRPNAH